MTLHAARLSQSERLQRVHALLGKGGEYSTMDIVRQARVCAVSTIISELRANGDDIACRRIRDKNGKPRWLYQMRQTSEMVMTRRRPIFLDLFCGAGGAGIDTVGIDIKQTIRQILFWETFLVPMAMP